MLFLKNKHILGGLCESLAAAMLEALGGGLVSCFCVILLVYLLSFADGCGDGPSG